MKDFINKIISKKSYLLAIIGILLLTFLTLGRSYIQTTLSIIGNSKIAKNSWIIYFDDVQISEDSVETANEDRARIVDRAKTEIDFDINLQKPGDMYEFTVYTVNDGTIDAMVDSIEKYELSAAQKEYLEFEVKYDSGEEIQRCDPLYHLGSELGPNRRLIKATVKFKRNEDINKYPTEGVNLHMYFRINYVQISDVCTPQVFKDYHVLKIRPNGGTYDGKKAETRVYLEEGDTYTILTPRRTMYNFEGWSVLLPQSNGTYTINDKTFTMGEEDVVIEANWKDGSYVARIMDTYYATIQDAFDAVDGDWEDNTVWLLRNVEEKPTNNARDDFIFNLGGFTIDGKITNPSTGNITLVNGRVEAPNNETEAFTNFGTLTLGKNDGYVEVENNIALVGRDYGLVNKSGSNFYFYDGYIEGVSGLVGGYTDKASGYYVFVNHNNDRNCQKVYLVKNPTRAVAKTTTNGDIYYYNLQDGINTVSFEKSIDASLTDNDFRLTVIRSFEAAYELTIDENDRIFIDLDGKDLQIGKKVTNDGYLYIYNSKPARSIVRPSMTIENNGEMKLENMNIVVTTDSVGIDNKGDLDISNTSVTGKGNYAISNTQDGEITFDQDTVIQSEKSSGLYNNSSKLVIDDGLIYGFVNEDTSGDVEITGNAKFRVKTYSDPTTTYTPVLNRGVMKQTGGDIYTDLETAPLINIGTYTITAGKIDSTYKSIDQNSERREGTINIEGGTVTGTNRVIDDGTVNVRNDATVYSENGPVAQYATFNLYSGTVYSENNTTIDRGNLNIYGGTLIGSDTVATSVSTFSMSGGTVQGDDAGITCTNANITGGIIEVENNALTVQNIVMTDGEITSSSATGVIINNEGEITGGTITGDLYGVQNKGELTLGTDDETITSLSPVLVGGSYGLYIEGPITNFYDGILKGQVQGYNEDEGRITGTPLGGTLAKGTEDINGIEYKTVFINDYKNWLRVGETEYNSVNAASEACSSTCTIEVIDDAYTTFVQEFVSGHTITFDLNGHTISGTQTIINNANTTIIDSSAEHTGVVEPDRVPQFTNMATLTIASGTFKDGTASSAILNKDGHMYVTGGTITAERLCIDNKDELTISGGTLTSANIGVDNTGSLNITGGTIQGTNIGIRANGTLVHVNGGTITGNAGVSGTNANIVMDNGTVHALEGLGLDAYWGSITVNGGEIIADHDVAVQSHRTTTITGGHIIGTNGVEHGAICGNGVCVYQAIDISGNPIIEGTANAGVLAHGSTLTITGGSIYGEVDGVQNFGATGRIGEDEGSISISNPLLQGKRYGLNTTTDISFFDGILKGKTAAHEGLISKIPDATMINDDYEYINRIEYKTQYLTAFGDWLQVGEQTFNTLTDACEAVTNNETIYVIKNAYVAFEQELVNNKTITLDLQGHQIIMTQPLETKGNETIIDSIGGGIIYNNRANTIVNSGTLTIKAGSYQTEKEYAFVNNGTLTIDYADINTKGCISNTGTLTVNDGEFVADTKFTIGNTGTATINGGTFYNDADTTINSSNGYLTINNGTITGDKSIAVDSSSYLTINGGEITGKTIGVKNTSDNSMSITGGHIVSLQGAAISTYGSNANITGGAIEGETYGIYNKGTTTLGSDDGVIAIDLPMVKGKSYGLYIDEGTLNFYDGIIKGGIEANYNEITNIPDRAEVFPDTETIDDIEYATKYLVTETDIVRNKNTGVVYSNFQDALSAAGNNHELELIANVPLYYQVINSNTNTYTLDLNGYYITTNKGIVNYGNITITNSNNLQESVIKTSSSIELFKNYSNLTFENVTLKNTSSDKYVVKNTSNLTMDNVSIDAINGVQNTDKAIISDGNFVTTKTAIENTGDLSVDGGSYTGANYAVYSNSIIGATLENATFNGSIYNNRGELNADNIVVNTLYKQAISNNATMNILNSETNGSGILSNTSTMLIDNSEINYTGDYYYSGSHGAIDNSGTLTIKGTTFHVDEDTKASGEAIGIYNHGTLTLKDESEINVGNPTLDNGTRYGILTYQNGTSLVQNSTINVNGGNKSYGMFVRDVNSHATIETGEIRVENGKETYGAYINLGTFTMGHYDNVQSQSDLVSTTDPMVYSSGTIRGIGVKKINGEFEFYDGVVWGSKYASPETTTLVEKLYEVTTYVDSLTGYEYAELEYMGDDWQNKPVAVKGSTYYTSLADAIDAYSNQDTNPIILLRAVSEDIVIESGKKAVIDLGGFSVVGKATIASTGELQLYNGSLENFNEYEYDEEEELIEESVRNTITIVNNGKLIIGNPLDAVSSTSVRIISEHNAIENNGEMFMYDGYIEGNPAMNGEIDHIADYARLHKVVETQYERIYLQSLDPASILSGETDLILTIDPDGGVYDNVFGEQHFYLKHGQSMSIDNTKIYKNGCNFLGWEVSDPTAYHDNAVYMDMKDVTLTAKWEITDRAVARINNVIYEDLREAIDDATPSDTVVLLKNVQDDITIRKEVKLDLGGYELSGNFINQGILTIDNGTIKNPNGVGLINLKTLTMGKLDKDTYMDSIKIIGTTLGLQQDGRFNFYDGNIQAEMAINGVANSKPKGKELFTEYITVDQQLIQKLYLSGTPEKAIASIEISSDTRQFFFELPEAIATAMVLDKEIDIESSDQANYDITIPEGANIVINMNSHDITTGSTITNNGTLRIYDNSDTAGSITSAKSIINNGDLTIQGIKIHQNKSVDTIVNNGTLTVKSNTVDSVVYPAVLEGTDKYVIVNNGLLSMQGSYQLNSDSYALKQSGTLGTIDGGTIHGIFSDVDTTITAPVNITYTVTSDANTLTLSNVSITDTTEGESCIYLDKTNVSVSVSNATMNCYKAAYLEDAEGNVRDYQSLTIDNSTVTASNIGIHVKSENDTINLNNVIFTSDQQTIKNEDYYNTYNITGSRSNFKSNNSYCIDDFNWKGSGNTQLSIDGGTYESPNNTIYIEYCDLYIKNATIKTTANNKDKYCIYGERDSDAFLQKNVSLIAESASGLFVRNSIEVKDGSSITVGHGNGVGIATRYLRNGLIEDSTIISTGENGYGIYSYEDYSDYTIKNSTISSKNIGIYLYNRNSDYTSTVDILSGTVIGEIYGIYVKNRYNTVNIGSLDDADNISNPVIQGNYYGVYRDTGTVNFYNGRLKGAVNGYNDYFDALRPAREIVKISELADLQGQYDLNTNVVSSTPVRQTAKTGNGYARLTYLSETAGTCTQNQTFDYVYKGSEDTFVTPCDGTYSIELWGASGGDAYESRGGYGAYAYGEINLTTGNTLYINVGGEGTGGSSSTAGYNGGGQANHSGSYQRGSGGGATHVATSSGLLSTLVDDKSSILLVAAGGGGAGWWSGSEHGDGGDAGGLIGYNGNQVGNYNSAGTPGQGGTQTAGGVGKIDSGSFGQGANRTDGSDYGGAGGGGGYYGGGAATNTAGGGGGSSYKSSSISNGLFFSYYERGTVTSWFVNYLVNREDFLQVGDNTYNNFADAITAIGNDTTAVINVLKDADISEAATFPADKNITLNLNGHTLGNSLTMVSNGDLYITDLTDTKKGKIVCHKNDLIQNNKNLKIHDVELVIEESGFYAITSKTASGSVEVKRSNIHGDGGVYYSNYAQEVLFDHVTIDVGGRVIYLVNANSDITIKNVTSTSVYSAIYLAGNYQNNSFDISDSSFTSTYEYTDENVSTVHIDSPKVTFISSDTDYISTYNDAIYFDYYNANYSTAEIDGGTIKGGLYGIRNEGCNTTIENATIETTSDSRDRYAILDDYYTKMIVRNCTIKADSGSGIYQISSLDLYNSTVTVGNSYGYGIVNRDKPLYVEGTTIKTTGGSSYGVYEDYNNTNTSDFVNTIIESNNIGLYYNYGSRTVNYTGGSIYGKVNGIYTNHANIVINLGKDSDPLNQQNPRVESENIAILKNDGTINFYNGRLVSSNQLVVGDINSLRKDHVIEYVVDRTGVTSGIVSAPTFDVSEEAISNTAKIGNGHARITLVESTGNEFVYEELTSIPEAYKTYDYPTKLYSYVDKAQLFTPLANGNYKIELWGASGGKSLYNGNNYDTGGKGGYTSGTIGLTTNDRLYFYVGGKGQDAQYQTPAQGGWNGGGLGEHDHTDDEAAGGGGGSTDVRITMGSASAYWNDFDSLKTRIMVAAGGGGGNESGYYGGNAGGLQGYDTLKATGGTQTTPGYNKNNINKTAGFGYGMDAIYFDRNHDLAGGGGGYYGGGSPERGPSNTSNLYYKNAAGGGSSYISGHDGCDAIDSSSTINNITHTHQSVHYSGKSFTDTKMIDGSGYRWSTEIESQEQMPDPNGGNYSLGQGHTGDGYARVSLLDNNYVGINLVSDYPISNDFILLPTGSLIGSLPIPEIDTTNYTFDGWFVDQAHTKKVTANTLINYSTTLYAKVSKSSITCVTDSYVDFDFTGAEEQFYAPCDGTYKLEVWGAQGGGANYEYIHGGYGGYASGNIALSANEKLYINVGQEGLVDEDVSGARTIYNGGGKATIGIRHAGTGGGATHIAFASGQLSSLESNKSSVIIVAGAGGGASNYESYQTSGGDGGGYEGLTGERANGNGGPGGTQTAGGSTNGKSGSFGQGGIATDTGGGGGGAGYYGGSGGYAAAGGGGSSYISHSRLTDGITYGYNAKGTGFKSIEAYLDAKPGFLEVNGVTYNSFDKAIAAISTTGTIKVLLDETIQQSSEFPAGKNITIDLNGKYLNLTTNLVNKGTLTITDNSSSVGTMDFNMSNGIHNSGTLTLNKGNFKSKEKFVYGETSNGTVNINQDAYIKADYGVYLSVAQTLNVTGTKMDVENTGIYVAKANSVVTITGATINSNNEGLRFTDRYMTVDITNSTFRTSGDTIFLLNDQAYGEYSITNCNMTSINGSVLYINNGSNTNHLPTIDIKDSTFDGYTSAMRPYYSIINIDHSNLSIRSTNPSNYVINEENWSKVHIFNHTVISAPNASGVRIHRYNTIEDSTIYANNISSYGLYIYYVNELIVKNTTIETPGSSSYGVYYDRNDNTPIDMTNVNIDSGNIGMYFKNTGGSVKTINFNSGSIIGKTYGIYQEGNSFNTIIGDSEAPVSTSNPHIEGGLYGIYEVSGNVNFYSGIIKGSTSAFYGNYSNIRDQYEVYEASDELAGYTMKLRTISTNMKSTDPIAKYAKEGNGYAKITYKNTEESIVSETILESIEPNKTQLFDYTGGEQVYIVPKTGVYKLEVWGAQGGTHNFGGYGGYSTGNIRLQAGQELYINVGGQGTYTSGGYNGGGDGASANDAYGYGGGGATHIATYTGLLSSLYNRQSDILIVAGGGGGSSGTRYSSTGGSGGGYIGGDGINIEDSNNWGIGYGGTQSTGGYNKSYYTWENAFGTFGQGGNYVSTSDGGTGGGGGYYGGGGGIRYQGPGGGGSGYIGNDRLYDKSMVCNQCPESSEESTKTISVIDSSIAPVSNKPKEGVGAAAITFVGEVEESSYTIKLTTKYGSLSTSTLTYSSGDVLGELPTPTIDSIYSFEGWYLDSNYSKKVTSSTVVNASATLYAKVIYKATYCTSKIGETVEFDYTGGPQEFTVDCPGTYELEVWGAQGGTATFKTNTSRGGYGGYSSANIDLELNEKLYIYVGGKGQSITHDQSSNTFTFDESYGYNGGGYADFVNNNGAFAGGGGATHIATKSGLLSNLYSYRNDILIVAGAGGGGAVHNSYPSNSGTGGNGGGYIGASAITANTTCYGYGEGGTQVVPGKYTRCASGSRYVPASMKIPNYASFGHGGNYSVAKPTTADYGFAGGGAGYFGGSFGYFAPGGGGSSYTGNDRLSNQVMYGYDVESIYANDSSNVNYLIPLTDKVVNTRTTTRYKNVQTALNEAIDNDVLELVDNSTISIELTVPDKIIELDLHGYTLTTNKSITNGGTLTITDETNSGNSKIINNLFGTLLTNNKTLTINNVDLKGDSVITNAASGVLNINNSDIENGDTGINNLGTMTLSNISIDGGTYGIYNNSTFDSTINGLSIDSKTSIYTRNTGKLTITGLFTAIGDINNDYANNVLNINADTNSSLVGFISNKGKTTIKNTAISKTISDNYGNNYIYNTSELTLENCTVTLVEQYSGSWSETNKGVNNTGTFSSISTSYSYSQPNTTYKYAKVINNEGIISLNGGSISASGVGKIYGIYTTSSNTSQIRNIDLDVKNAGYNYGLYMSQGDITITGGGIETVGNNNYTNAITMLAGTLTIDNATIKSNGPNTLAIDTRTGIINVKSGEVIAEGTSVIGIKMDSSTLTLGTQDGNVGTTTPSIKATGTTSGIGIDMGNNGTVNMYDGNIMGTTGYLGDSDTISVTESGYYVKESTYIDPETNNEYYYCELDIRY